MQVKKRQHKYLYWAPRIISVVFILFLSLFALDVFIPGKSLNYYVIALFMHLLPNILLIILLIFAWRYEKLGGLLFIAAGIVFTVLFNTYEYYLNFLVVSFPLFLVGGLFLLHNHFSKR